jgi:hypothetical protein
MSDPVLPSRQLQGLSAKQGSRRRMEWYNKLPADYKHEMLTTVEYFGVDKINRIITATKSIK